MEARKEGLQLRSRCDPVGLGPGLRDRRHGGEGLIYSDKLGAEEGANGWSEQREGGQGVPDRRLPRPLVDRNERTGVVDPHQRLSDRGYGHEFGALRANPLSVEELR